MCPEQPSQDPRSAGLGQPLLELIATQEALAACAAHQAAILKAVPDGIITFDQSGSIREFNPSAERIFGYRRTEVLGKDFATLILPPPLRDGHYQRLDQFSASGDREFLYKRVESVKAYAGQIEQLVLNLAVNARDAMPAGGILTIETSDAVLDETFRRVHPDAPIGRFVLLSVRDTGCGMDESTLARIFEPFFTTKEPDRGTGLGLSTVRGVVQRVGGHIEVYSRIGVGSLFQVYLPIADGQSAQTQSASEAVLPVQGGVTVLLVEDDEQVRSLASMVLQGHGYRVLEAHSGADADTLSLPRATGSVRKKHPGAVRWDHSGAGRSASS